MQSLGGLRHSHKDSINMDWQKPAFVAMPITCRRTLSLRHLRNSWHSMERPLWRSCAQKRYPGAAIARLLAMRFLVQTHRVEDIFVTPAGKTHRRLHTLTSFARVQGSKLWYPEDAMLAPFPDESRNITLKGDRRQDGVKKHTGRPQAVRSFLKKF